MRPEIGLPFERFLFERGVWQSRNVKALVQWSSIDESFLRHGIALDLRHATTPKAKIIEQVIGAIQNLDEYAPGYVGRGEQRVKYERVQGFLQKLKRAGQPLKAGLNPADMLMSADECVAMLSEVMQRFADEPQNGERLDGLSPAEGWHQLSGGRVHQVLPESLRFILGTAESRQTVTSEGIELRIGNRKHYYFGSDRLGALQGEKVCVRYNPELPEQVIVSHPASDPHALQPFSVPLFERVSATHATADEFRSARDHQARFVSYGRALYRELAPKSNRTICHAEIGSPELRAAGEANNRLEREHIELKSERESQRGEIKRLAAQQNLGIDPGKVRRPARVAKHLRSAAEWEAKILALEQTEAFVAATSGIDHSETSAHAGSISATATKKVFVLNGPAKQLTPQQRNGMYWRLWKAAEGAQPGLNRFAITNRALGRVKKIAQMTDEEFLKVCHVFESIAKKGAEL
jgi:hypothetical protein